MLRKAALSLVAILWLATISSAQEDGHFDVSLGITGLAAKQTTGNGTIQTSTKSAAFLGTVRLRFTARQSIEANYARGNDSQIYTTPFVYRIQSNISEFTGAYVFSPIETKHFEPFIFGGAGVLVFNPFETFVQTVQTSVPSVRQTEFAALYGAGFDYRFFSIVPLIRRTPASTHLALRLQYRGLFYKAPNFKNPTLFTGGLGHVAEAGIGIVIKF